MPKDMVEYEPGPRPVRDVWRAMWNGQRQRCPSCGEGALYYKYLKVNASPS
jgi:uncharacterized protein (DUF983 family)